MTTYQQLLGNRFWESRAAKYFSDRTVVKVIILKNNSMLNFVAIFSSERGTYRDAFFCPYEEMVQRCIIYGIPLEEE